MQKKFFVFFVILTAKRCDLIILLIRGMYMDEPLLSSFMWFDEETETMLHIITITIQLNIVTIGSYFSLHFLLLIIHLYRNSIVQWWWCMMEHTLAYGCSEAQFPPKFYACILNRTLIKIWYASGTRMQVRNKAISIRT